jgi:hypothetical protein
MIGISFQRALMAQARELGDKAMRNLARLREEASEGMAPRISPRTWLAFCSDATD